MELRQKEKMVKDFRSYDSHFCSLVLVFVFLASQVVFNPLSLTIWWKELDGACDAPQTTVCSLLPTAPDCGGTHLLYSMVHWKGESLFSPLSCGCLHCCLRI